jgi:hypothetical protein
VGEPLHAAGVHAGALDGGLQLLSRRVDAAGER